MKVFARHTEQLEKNKAYRNLVLEMKLVVDQKNMGERKMDKGRKSQFSFYTQFKIGLVPSCFHNYSRLVSFVHVVLPRPASFCGCN